MLHSGHFVSSSIPGSSSKCWIDHFDSNWISSFWFSNSCTRKIHCRVEPLKNSQSQFIYRHFWSISNQCSIIFLAKSLTAISNVLSDYSEFTYSNLVRNIKKKSSGKEEAIILSKTKKTIIQKPLEQFDSVSQSPAPSSTYVRSCQMLRQHATWKLKQIGTKCALK